MLPVIRTIVTVLYILVCVALVIVIILQEGKSAGLGTISGAAETYWGKNKGRSMEGGLIRGTQILTGVFFVLSLILNLKW
ncbi:MAG: preprotein translocase subunit SecG [Lachnospiraceae bacterium]|jgi:preprotein translocase, secG subunit|nr:preprotein translocase subunit SecG [Lachnoclostridium sp.]MDD7522456.1 preprotein translocase subunit SecG [Lachnoclostridium sp.]MDY2599224.1 preprotein translocase subunit SecG [Lachnospiraceae bacterium]